MSGRITDERFTELSADYEQEQAALKERAIQLQAVLDKAQEAGANVEPTKSGAALTPDFVRRWRY